MPPNISNFGKTVTTAQKYINVLITFFLLKKMFIDIPGTPHSEDEQVQFVSFILIW